MSKRVATDKVEGESLEKKCKMNDKVVADNTIAGSIDMDKETHYLLECVKNLKKAVEYRDLPGTEQVSCEHLEAQRILKWMIEYNNVKFISSNNIRWQYVGISPKCRDLLRSWGIETEKSGCLTTNWWDLRLIDPAPEINENLA
jgi:hypothetical protein